MRLRGYILPDLSRLSTSLLQEQVLQILREHAVIAFKFLTEEKRRIRRIMTAFNNKRGSSRNLLVESHQTNLFNILSKLFNMLIPIIQVWTLSKLYTVTPLLTFYPLQDLW